MRRNIFVIATFMALVSTVSCGSRTASPEASAGKEAPPVKAESAPDSPPTVALTMTSSIKNRHLTIKGTTDLPNGALISYEVRHEGAAIHTDVPMEKMFADGNSVVEGGQYLADVNLEGWPRGELTVWVAFQTILGMSKHQPPVLLTRFGEMGEKLTGANVSKAGYMKRVELTEKLRLR